ncbi:CU044_2847 family protein [Streptomyces sp. NPDC021356]|uniref:CU044_2847 family protein n=1 Tax=Streptomyces sp. NPDC021356 TaxID=3154900 RepID=UPI0033F2F987
MESISTMVLPGGGEIAFEVATEAELPVGEGPVKAGRVGDAVRRMPQTLQNALEPVREMTRTVVDQLREVGPEEVEIEFGLNLSGQVGVIVNKGEAAAHLKIKMLWRKAADAGDEV